MSDPDPEFGVRQPDMVYLERPGAYAIIRGTGSRLAFVRGEAGRLFLPGGGVQPGEPPEDALRREIIEEIGWRALILDVVGRATQFLAVEGEGCFAIRAIYFRARLIERVTTGCEREIVWLPAATATALLARESDAWAISRVCDSDAILRQGKMTASKPDLYRDLAGQLAALLAGETDRIANAANMAALIYHSLPDLNWAGFYFRRGHELVLGPFQGRPACVRIPLGKGVCGTAAARAATVLVPDVRDFAGHIACDPNSRSELVVPLLPAVAGTAGEVLGVLDLDSPLLARFDAIDQAGCEQLVALFVDHHHRNPG